METTENETQAPDIWEGYPSNGRRIGPAWAAMWERLEVNRADEGYLDGRELAQEVAEAGVMVKGKHRTMSPETLTNLLQKAANYGLLERTYREGSGTRGRRTRAWYRIKREA